MLVYMLKWKMQNTYINYYYIIFNLLVLRNALCLLPRVDPLVLTAQGLIRGLRATDGDYSMFLGIPYAKVDPGNPFGAAIAHPAFEDIFSAFDDSAKCPQIEEFNNTIVGSLDCLHLNIYVPNIANTQNPLPVLVWIHGGGFAYGFGGRYIYGPRYLVSKDIILITINYRLGPYGFMCLDIPSIPGNQGLKDQLLALRWINENIGAFGGNANQVTIFGESAGAVSVNYHLLSPHEKNFNKVILQSDTSELIRDPDYTAPIKLAKYLGYKTDDVNDALLFLYTVDTDLVIAATSYLQISFVPCVEKKFNDVDIFIENHPINLSAARKIANMPVLIGFNSDEGLVFFGDKPNYYYDTLNDIFIERINNIFAFDSNEQLQNMSKIVRHFYIGDEPITAAVKDGLNNFYSDFRFVRPTIGNVDKFLAEGSGNIYMYMFSYTGERNFVKSRLNITFGGAAHADEMGFLFEQIYNINKPATSEDQLIIDRLSTMWANFVKIGNPTPQITELLPVKWLSVTTESRNYLHIDLDIKVDRQPFKERMAFWKLFYSSNKQYIRGMSN